MGNILEHAKEKNARINYVNRRKVCLRFTSESLQKLSEYLLSDACVADIESIEKKEYRVSVPTVKKTRKRNNNGFRKVYVFNEKDIMLISYLVYLLNLETPFLDCLYSFLPHRSAYSAIFKIKQICSLKEDMPGYKIDLRKYDQNIDKSIAKKQCRNYITDDELLFLFESFINSGDYYEGGVLKHDAPGVRPGIAFTNYIENIYLHDLDYMIMQTAHSYFRFGDDMVFFSRDRESLELLKDLVLCYLKNYKLIINEEKSCDVNNHNFEYVGCTVINGELGLSSSYYERIERIIRNSTHHFLKTKRLLGLSDNDAMAMAVKYYKNFVKAYACNFAVINKINDMKRVDHLIQNSLRTIGTGKFSNSRYRIKIPKLHELGYRSIVNEFFNRTKKT